MPTPELPPINVHLPGADAAMGNTPLKSSTSPSFLATDDEQLTQTVHCTYDGKSITYDIVIKRVSLVEPDTKIEVDPIPGNIFEKISKGIFHSCFPFKMRRVKTKSSSASGTT